jgi:hypothetical protein
MCNILGCFCLRTPAWNRTRVASFAGKHSIHSTTGMYVGLS